jgi:hypothetical protein
VTTRRRRRPATAGDAGSAVVDFALVGGLLTLLFMAVVQLGVLLHVRNTVTDCVAEGARYGALAGHAPSQAAARVHELLAAELGEGYADRTSIVRATEADVGGVRVVEVTAAAPVALVGLAGPARVLTVTGHAVAEQR